MKRITLLLTALVFLFFMSMAGYSFADDYSGTQYRQHHTTPHKKHHKKYHKKRHHKHYHKHHHYPPKPVVY